MMIHEANNKDSTKIKMKLGKEDLSNSLNIANNKMTDVLTSQTNNDPCLYERVEENTNTKNKGVWYNARTRCWLTCVKGTGRHLRVFSVKKYGYKQAKMLALECKSSMCSNDESLLKKQEPKEEAEINIKNGRTINGKTDGYLNGNIHRNGVVIDRWESINGDNEKGTKPAANEAWENKIYNDFYFNNVSSDGINNKTNSDTNTNIGNNNQNNGTNFSHKKVKDLYVNDLNGNNSNHVGNDTPNEKMCSSGESNNDAINYSTRKVTKRGNKSLNKGTTIYESNEKNLESPETPNNANSMNVDSESKEMCDSVDKHNENDWTNRRYNTRRGNQVLANETKGIRKSNTGNSNSSGMNHSEATVVNGSKNIDAVKNDVNHINNFNIVKRRRRGTNRYGENDKPNDNEESENDQAESEKAVAIVTHNNTMKNCLITAEDFQLDSSESTDNEQIFFNPFSSDLSEKGNGKKRKKNKEEEKGMNYIFTNGYYSDSKHKSKKMKTMYKNVNLQNHNNDNMNAYDGGEGNSKLNRGHVNGWIPSYNALSGDQTCSLDNRCNHMNGLGPNKRNSNTNDQVMHTNRKGIGEEDYRKNINKENSEKNVSNYKTNFLDLTREALILILKDLKTNVIPRIATEHEKKERYVNVLRLCLRNAKYTKHFNELEPYLDLFGECIRNSKLPSNMGIQDQLSYLEKL